jgi:hypothetical protein
MRIGGSNDNYHHISANNSEISFSARKCLMFA